MISELPSLQVSELSVSSCLGEIREAHKTIPLSPPDLPKPIRTINSSVTPEDVYTCICMLCFTILYAPL